MSENKPLIEVKGLKEYFNINVGMLRSKPLKAVDDVSFFINKGETLGLVGESGCGKTTVGRTLLHLYKPTAGEIYYDGKLIKKGAVVTDVTGVKEAIIDRVLYLLPEGVEFIAAHPMAGRARYHQRCGLFL